MKFLKYFAFWILKAKDLSCTHYSKYVTFKQNCQQLSCKNHQLKKLGKIFF